MPLLSARLLVPLAVVVVAWGGLHLVGAHTVTISPATWPGAVAPPTPPPNVMAPVPLATASPSPPATGAIPLLPGAIPLLPGALRQLNGSTRGTAVALYALVRELEHAVRTQIQQITQQLEPGR